MIKLLGCSNTVSNFFFRPFGPHFGLKIRGGGVGGTPGPSPGFANVHSFFTVMLLDEVK